MSRAREATVKLVSGEELHLRLDFNAMARIEEELGQPWMGGAKDADAPEQFSARDTLVCVHACCAAYDEARDREPSVTKRQLGTMLDVSDITAVSVALYELTKANAGTSADATTTPADHGETSAEAPPPGAPASA